MSIHNTVLSLAVIGFVNSGAFCASTTDSADHVLSGEYPVDVASGNTLTMSGVISGDGSIRKTGAGMLVLNNGGNTFSGGLFVDGGQVSADTQGCLGSGLITITPTESSKVGIYFNASGATFDNDFRVEGVCGGESMPVLEFAKSTVINGGITNACTSYKNSAGKTSSPYYRAINGASVEFNGHLHTKATGGSGPLGLRIENTGSMRVKGGISCKRFNPAIGGYGHLYLGGTNKFDEIQLGYPNLHLLADNVIPTNLPFYWTMCPHDDSRHGNLELDGHDQTLAGLAWNSSGRTGINGGDTVNNSAERTSTLTLNLDKSYITYAALNGNLNLVVNGGSYTQTLGTNRNNTISGEIIVSNGTLVANRTWFPSLGALRVRPGASFKMYPESGAFAGLQTLELEGTLDLTGWADGLNPFVDNVTDLELSADATLKLPETMSIRVKSLSVGGNPLPNGRYAAGATGTPAAIQGGIVYVGKESVTWNAGGGADTRTSLAANWNGAELQDDYPPDATVGTAGTVATVDRALYLNTLNLAAPTVDGFTFASGGAEGAVYVGDGGLLATNVTEGRVTDSYRFEVPVTFTGGGSKTLNVPTNTVVTFAAGLNERDGATVTMNNPGTVVIGGNSDIRGTFNCSNGNWRVSGVIGPEDTDNCFRVQARSTELIPGSNKPWLWAKIVLDGVTFKKPFWAEADNMFANSATWLTCTAGKTNVFYKQVRFYHRSVNFVMNGSTCICSNGVAIGGKLYVNGGHMIIRGGKQALDCNDEHVQVYQNSTLDVYSTANRWGSKWVQGSAAASSRLNLFADHAMDAEATNFASLNLTNLTVDVFGTHQSVRKLTGKNGSITGTGGSRLDVLTEGDMAGDVKGALSLWMCGRWEPRLLRLRNRNFTTTGDLVCTNGTVVIESSASWHGDVKAIDAGVIEVAAANAFDSSTTVLTLKDNGRVNVPAGVTVKVAELWLDDATKPARSGTYGKIGSGATYETSHITGDGFVKAVAHGMRIYMR